MDAKKRAEYSSFARRFITLVHQLLVQNSIYTQWRIGGSRNAAQARLPCAFVNQFRGRQRARDMIDADNRLMSDAEK